MWSDGSHNAHRFVNALHFLECAPGAVIRLGMKVKELPTAHAGKVVVHKVVPMTTGSKWRKGSTRFPRAFVLENHCTRRICDLVYSRAKLTRRLNWRPRCQLDAAGAGHRERRLTPQFSGRAMPCDSRRERIMKWRARAAAATTYHGPLQLLVRRHAR